MKEKKRKEKTPSPPRSGKPLGGLVLAIHHGILMALFVLGTVVSLNALAYVIRDLAPIRQYVGLWVWVILGIATFATIMNAAAFLGRGISWLKGKWQRVYLAPFRLLFYLLILGQVTRILLFPLFNIVLIFLTLSASFGLFALVIVVERRLAETFNVRFLKALDILLLNVCLLVVVGEMGLRILARVASTPLLSQTAGPASERIEQNRYPAGIMRYGFPCNTGGHYDTEFVPIEGDGFLVVSLGDSFSAGVVNHSLHFTTVVECLLKGCTVYNMGMPSIGPWEYAHLIRTEAHPLRPNALVINLFVGNDLIGAQSVAYKSNFYRSWFDSENIMLYVVLQRITKLFREKDRTGRLPGTLQGEMKVQNEIIDDPDEAIRHFPWMADPMKEKPTFSKEAFLKIEQRRADAVCTSEHGDFDRFVDALDEIREEAGETALAFVLIPDEFQVEDGLWSDITALSGEKSLDRFRPQRIVMRWLEEHEIPYLDLLPVFATVNSLEDGRKHIYHLHDTHFNARGNRIAGEALAKFLSSLSEVITMSDQD